jgi:hypothetical protein
MREAEVAHVGNKHVGQFQPRERPPVGVASPERRVHLVDRERRGMKISHTPQSCHNRIGCRRPSQVLKGTRRSDDAAPGRAGRHRAPRAAAERSTGPPSLDHAVPVDAEPVFRPLADFRIEQPRHVHAPEGGQRLPRPRQCRHRPRPVGLREPPSTRLRGAARALRTDRRASPAPAPRSSAAGHASTFSPRRFRSRLASMIRPRSGMPIQAGRLPAS